MSHSYINGHKSCICPLSLPALYQGETQAIMCPPAAAASRGETKEGEGNRGQGILYMPAAAAGGQQQGRSVTF